MEYRAQATMVALALTAPKELQKPPAPAGVGDGTPFATPPALRDDADTRHDVGTVAFETEKWW